MNPQELQKIIRRYLDNSATPEEKAIIDAYFDRTENNDINFSDQERTRIEQEMFAIISEYSFSARAPKQKNAFILRMRPLLRVAAAIGGLLFIAFWFYSRNYRGTSDSANLAIVKTHRGERVKLVLADSSEIWVNSTSSLRYPKSFSADKREVYLDKGEAFFKVKHDPEHPFIVHTAYLNTQVLGTSFNISIAGKTSVTVKTGKVSVQKNTPFRQLAMLLPGKQLMYDPANGEYNQTSVDANDESAWANNVLVLKDADFNRVKLKLEQWYGVDIHLPQKVSTSCLFTARFENKSITEVLNSLKMINRFEYSVNGRLITINKIQCK